MTRKARKLKNELQVDKGESEIHRDAEPRRRRTNVRDAFDIVKCTAPVHDPEIHGPSLVQQHFKEEVDINRIVKRYAETGILTHFMKQQADYAFAPSTTFTEAMFMVTEAQEQFNQLPAEARAHFNNDPATFLDAAHDEGRRQEFVDLGLIPEPQEQAPMNVYVTNQPDPGLTDPG